MLYLGIGSVIGSVLQDPREPADEIGGGSSDAKREGWDDATSEPEDFPLGPACDLSGEGGCEACT